MAKRDYYETLGVSQSAEADELKRAYRGLAMKFHPDRNPDDPEAEQSFKEVSEAYEVLKDAEKRAAYDQYGHAAFDGKAPGAGFGFTASSFADVFDDLFGDFVGGRRGATGGGRRGADLRYNLEVTLEDAYHGKSATIRTTSTVTCEPCAGSGAEKGSKPITCRACEGAGKVRAQQGFFSIERTCPTCRGAGRIIENPCRECRGGGRVNKEKQLQVNIPKGVEDGMRIRLTGEGEAGVRGGPTGDLYIFLAVAAHRLFRRDRANLFCEIPLSMTTAALGGTIEVPDLSGGRSRLTIPEGTQSGRQFRLRGKGMPSMRGDGMGDMVVQARIETPVNLTAEQKEILRGFEKAAGKDTSPEAEGFFTKVKELWDDLRD
ncbi:MAG: molecular chaperone DnaJ [Alphaproteobacteria bacterium]|jgi:molecular chaperone DnaJ|nr:molecular chaperone DnaJ [Alphaproteobacteria bacterium]MDP6517492.1 molecular chaperone DnaJ [Alphaproteobacteria bacterium]